MRYLITGGYGFIGSNLVERLKNEGNEIVIIDNFTTGDIKNVKTKNESHYSFDILPELEKFDGIFHLGMPSNSLMYKENPILVSSVLRDWTLLLEYAKKTDCKIVFASTSSMYSGNPTPYQEDMPIHIFDFYTESRVYLERLGKLYYDLYKVKNIGLRFFSVYGTKERAKGRYANMLSQFLWCFQRGESPVIFGNGNQSRDTIYVDDVVEAMILAINSNIENDIFNVGTGVSYSFNQMLELLGEFIKPIYPTYIENPIKNYVKTTLADTNKAQNILGFKAKVGIKEGIQKILEEA